MNEVNSVDVFPSCGDETNSFGAAFLLNANKKNNYLVLIVLCWVALPQFINKS